MKGYYLMPHPPLIVPEVGKGQEKQLQKTIDGCNMVGEEIEKLDADTLVIVTPHGTVFNDAVALTDMENLRGDLSKFGAAQVSFNMKINTRLTREILKQAAKSEIPTVALNRENAKTYGVTLELDHGTAVPLYFIKNPDKYEIVHITYGMLSPVELYCFGMAVEEACKKTGTEAVMIASGDLSHRLLKNGPYPFSPFGSKFDTRLMEILGKGDFKGLFQLDGNMVAQAGECGLRSVYILAGALDKTSAKAEILSYEGPFGVGYGVAGFNISEGYSIYEEIKNLGKEAHVKKLQEGPPYTRLVRRNLETWFKTGRPLTVKDIKDKELLREKKGVFVSLKISGQLRGCIGTIEAVTASVGEELLSNSISAAFNDPRFSPLKEEELYQADISVDLLDAPEECSFQALDPQEYGVIVTAGRKRGLLLPMLEGIDSSEEQVSVALKKAGIRKSQAYRLERFKVERFKEAEG
ncbi:2-aminophenol 1,6-dioxygenase subunit beta [Ruminiclostridium hungatei]|uniref:2-aminophenol 1,6-dioxygenase subunit beta n=1 Tax=Ruminiclostridium hungatei TaxID=48256 RepID=A0A1V4SKS1_RUMHU|nr:AmmeMemoRadiSam system protein A [Ruminiclostridium hungatei]OPX44096.1 2-aminophenol 1,6-dioxygenase subunit beta [Ruminiclostridium hungatei]